MRKPFKKADKDLTIEDMPHNRVEVWVDIIKQRWEILLYLGLLFLAFAIPLIVTSIADNMIRVSVLSPIEDEAQRRVTAFGLDAIFAGIESICILLLCLPFSGASRIYRLLCFYEGFSFQEDFWKGVKQNVGQTFWLFLFLAIAFFTSKISISYLFSSGNNDFLYTILFFLPAALSLLLLLPITMLHYAEVPIYANSFGQNARNGFYFYLKSGFTSLPFSLLLIAPLFCCLIPLVGAPAVTIGLYFLVYLPLALLAYLLHDNWVFDRFLNKEKHPDIFDRGVYRNKKED